MSELATTMSVRDLIDVILRRKWIVCLIFLLTSSGVIAGMMFLPPRYAATASLLVKVGREFYYQPEVGTINNPRTYSVTEMVNSEVEILMSRKLARDVLESIGAEKVYPKLFEEPDVNLVVAREHALESFLDKLAVFPILESSVIKIRFEHEEPEIVSTVVNLMVEKFLDKHVEVFSSTTSPFLEEQRRRFESDLREAEGTLEAFRNEHGIYDVTQQLNLLFSQRIALDSKLKSLEADLAELAQRRETLGSHTAVPNGGAPYRDPSVRHALLEERNTLEIALKQASFRLTEADKKLEAHRRRASGPPEEVEIMYHPGIEQLNSFDEPYLQLLRLRQRETELLRNFRPTNRQVVALREQIAMVQEFIDNHSRFLNSYMARAVEAELAAELDAASARREAIEETVAPIEAEILALTLQSLEERWLVAQASKAEVVKQVEAIDLRVKELNERGQELKELTRLAQIAEDNYRTYLRKYEDSRIREDLDRRRMVNVEVIERAETPVLPKQLSNKLKAVIGMMTGGVTAIAIAFLLELLGVGRRPDFGWQVERSA